VTEHSKTPWELSPQGYIIPTADSHMAMLKLKSPWIEGAWDDDKEAAANAALIVKAVNNHDALVNALTDTLCELTHCAEQLGAREYGSVRRAQTKARLILDEVSGVVKS
jgi:hypothetical protein